MDIVGSNLAIASGSKPEKKVEIKTGHGFAGFDLHQVAVGHLMETLMIGRLTNSMRPAFHFPLCLLALLSALPAGAVTSVAYSSLDPFGGYDYATGRAINGTSFVNGYQAWAYRFVAVQGGPLSNIELAVQYALFSSGPGDQVDVRLALDTNGLFSNATTLSAGSVTLTSSFGSGDLRTFTPSNSVTLTTGSAYWLAVTPHSNSTVADWCVSSTGATGKYALSLDGVNWIQDQGAPFSAFRVNIGVVPEPTATALGFLGSGILLGFRRSSRQR